MCKTVIPKPENFFQPGQLVVAKDGGLFEEMLMTVSMHDTTLMKNPNRPYVIVSSQHFNNTFDRVMICPQKTIHDAGNLKNRIVYIDANYALREICTTQITTVEKKDLQIYHGYMVPDSIMSIVQDQLKHNLEYSENDISPIMQLPVANRICYAEDSIEDSKQETAVEEKEIVPEPESKVVTQEVSDPVEEPECVKEPICTHSEKGKPVVEFDEATGIATCRLCGKSFKADLNIGDNDITEVTSYMNGLYTALHGTMNTIMSSWLYMSQEDAEDIAKMLELFEKINVRISDVIVKTMNPTIKSCTSLKVKTSKNKGRYNRCLNSIDELIQFRRDSETMTKSELMSKYNMSYTSVNRYIEKTANIVVDNLDEEDPYIEEHIEECADNEIDMDKVVKHIKDPTPLVDDVYHNTYSEISDLSKEIGLDLTVLSKSQRRKISEASKFVLNMNNGIPVNVIYRIHHMNTKREVSRRMDKDKKFLKKYNIDYNNNELLKRLSDIKD